MNRNIHFSKEAEKGQFSEEFVSSLSRILFDNK
jgi:hypothetical protein